MFTNAGTSEYSMLDCSQTMPLVIEKPSCNFNKAEIAPNCPRCASSNTKFCYYNNYSFSQPRYFCKGCKRYWTKGGSLRNVPVGGGCRKSRRSRARQMAGVSYPAPCPDVGSINTSERGTEIDMAAVFAKYVNPHLDHEESSSPGVSSESLTNVLDSSSDIDSQMGDIGMMFEYHDQLDWINDQVFPQMAMDHVNDQDLHAFEVNGHGLIGDNPVGDMVSSDGTNSESHSQLQDFGLFSPEYQLKISEYPTTDTWRSFDLSAYEFF